MSDILNQMVITLDADWAPECAIDYVTNLLLEKRIKATWYITHDSPAIRRVFEHKDIFECGIHQFAAQFISRQG